jgi:hypothetical protein
MFRLAVKPTQPPVERVPRVFPWKVKLLAWKVDRSPPSIAKIKNEWKCTSALSICTHGMDREKTSSFYPLQQMATQKINEVTHVMLGT